MTHLLSGELSRHAENLQIVRERFSAVKDASAAIAGDGSGYGLLCQWITETFAAKHVRQDELVEFVAENLRLIRESLYQTAELEAPAHDLVRRAAGNSLIAAVPEQTVVRGWTLEQIEPLRELLDQATGRPDVIASHVATWNNIAFELKDMADDLAGYVEYDLPGWRGAQAADHQRLMAHNIQAINGLSAISAALAEITASVGMLVTQTRLIMRDLVVDLMALAVPMPGFATREDKTFAHWACRSALYAVALETTLAHLRNRLES